MENKKLNIELPKETLEFFSIHGILNGKSRKAMIEESLTLLSEKKYNHIIVLLGKKVK